MTRRGYFWITYFAVFLIVAMSFVSVTPRLLWNASASVPIGFYTLHPIEYPMRGDLVAITPPERLERFMVERGTIASGVPLLKHVAAMPGQEVCRRGRTITVDGMSIGDALDRDRKGRDLPVWRGCRRIAADEVFLMNAGVPDSLDGRYFGPLPRETIVGRAVPLWTDEAGDGRFVWRADTSPTPP